MNKPVILNITLFLLGFAAAAGWFYIKTASQNQPATIPAENNQRQKQPDLASIKMTQDIASHQLTIKNQNQQIAALKGQLASSSKPQKPEAFDAKSETVTEALPPPIETNDPPLKKMTMQDFEESMKDSFVDRFKGVVLELSGSELEAIKKSYSDSSDKNDWSYQYENSITNFLSANDLNGDHFVQTINCNTQICRLEINTNDDESWSSLYASMTQQPWYKTITVEENSDYPGNHIYYLPSIDN